jgi:hypothetical protein
MLPHHSMPPMSIATFPDENSHLAGAAGAATCVPPSAPSAHESHRQMMMINNNEHAAAAAAAASGNHGPGAISELAGLQNELEGIQAGIHQVRNSCFFTSSLSKLSGVEHKFFLQERGFKKAAL